MDGTEKGPAEIIAEMRAEIDAKEAEVSRLQEALNQPDPKMAEMTGKLRWELADKDQELAGLQNQLSQKSQALAGFQAELGQLKFVDMDGREKGPSDIIADMRAEIEEKESLLREWKHQREEVGLEDEVNLTEYIGKLKWELAQKEEAQQRDTVAQIQQREIALDQIKTDLQSANAEVARLSGALAQFHIDGAPASPEEFRGHYQKQLDEQAKKLTQQEAQLTQFSSGLGEMIGMEEGISLEPQAAFARLQQEVETKSAEIARIQAEKQQLGMEPDESLTEFAARLNMERDGLLKRLNSFTYQGLRVTPEDALAKQDAAIQAKDQEIDHLLGELAQLTWEGVQLRPADFAQKVQSMLTAKEQELAQKEEELQTVSLELDNLKYVNQAQETAAVGQLIYEDNGAREGERSEAQSVETEALPFDATYKEVIPGQVYQLLLGYKDAGISLSNHDGHFLVFNNKLQELTEYSIEEANDTSEKIFLEKIYPDGAYRGEVAAQIANIPEDGSFNSIQTYITTKFGKSRKLNVSSTTFYHKGMKYYLSAYEEVEA